ncbi:MAG: Rrf2 family transcriptional regulator [Epsilonproteobacteria bacterium]|nr:Rrf2 family transcriptional regulator [Campylobacterota bacterium]
MLLTKASEYAMLSLVLISRQNSPEDVDTLSKRLNISRSFLAKVLQALAREGILKSYKGAKGGFSLNLKPEEISIRKVIEVVEKKPITIFECAQDTGHCPTGKGDFCMIWPFLNKFQSKIDDFLNEMTLKDIL